MRNLVYIALSLAVASLALLATGCRNDDEEEFSNDAYGNFDALWTVIDEHYCFFAYKQVNWDSVRTAYRARITSGITSQELFNLCAQMLEELRDGHTNLISASNVSRYWIWEKYPVNYDERIIDQYYLNFKYNRASGIKYGILANNIGYLYYGTFQHSIGEGNLDAALSYLATCDGLVIDVRSNGGGYLTNVETLVGRFISQRTMVGSICHKKGPGHNDFSKPYNYYFKPTGRHIHYDKPVAVLANRGSFSATNNFVSIMKLLPGVTVVGDTTGGGGGLPFTSELPNGWTVRFSSCPIADATGQVSEFGVAPDIKIDMDDADRTHDAILDRACQYLITGK